MALVQWGSVAATGPNVQITTQYPILIAGRLRVLFPLVTSTTTASFAGGYPHGRAYCMVDLWRMGQFYANLFAGYVTCVGSSSLAGFEQSFATPTSYPDLEILENDYLVITVSFGSNGSSGDTVNIWELIDPPSPDQASHPTTFYEVPATGPGEIITFHPGNPSAGSDLGFITVPALVRWKLKAYGATLTTAVAVANRQPVMQFTGSATAHPQSYDCLPFAQAASLVWTYGWAVGSTSAQTVSALTPFSFSVGLTDRWLPGGLSNRAHNFGVVTANIQAADAWTNITYVIEEWAMPDNGALSGG